MPSKFNLLRRKSGGNDLEAMAPPTPSFRVLERPTSEGKTVSGGARLNPYTGPRPQSDGRLLDQMPLEQGRLHPFNRSSDGTQHSSSSGGPYDTSSSSRHSTSTLPSNSSAEGIDALNSNKKTKQTPNLEPVSNSSPKSFFRAAKERTFSLGGKKAQSYNPLPLQTSNEPMPQNANFASFTEVPVIDALQRPRALTEASNASNRTATPFKLLDQDLSLGGDDFGSMFSGLGDRGKRLSKSVGEMLRSELNNTAMASQVGPTSTYARASPPPESPITPYSNQFPPEKQGLISTSPTEVSSSSMFPASSQTAKGKGYQALRKDSSMSDYELPSQRKSSRPMNRGLHRQSQYALSPEALQMDEDARLVAESVKARERMDSRSYSFDHETSGPVDKGKGREKQSSLPLSDSPKRKAPTTSGTNSRDNGHRGITLTDGPGSNQTTPRANYAQIEDADESALGDLEFQDLASTAARFESGRSTPPRPTIAKRMTQAQFERYKNEKELIKSDIRDDDASDEDVYDEEEDLREKAKQTARQRREQEAKMTVFRQSMMKTTGEQPGKLPIALSTSRPNMGRASASEPALNTRASRLDFTGPSPNDTEDDEDENIPLAVLRAHGFPNKDRAPSRIDRPGAPNINYVSQAYPTPLMPAPGSIQGGPSRGGKLPVFARNLPADPHSLYGLQQPADRQALGFANAGPSSQRGGGGRTPSVPLVQIIQNEEYAKAARKGLRRPDGTIAAPDPGFGINGHGGNTSPTSPFAPPNAGQAQLQAQLQSLRQTQQEMVNFMAQQSEVNRMQMQQMHGGQQPMGFPSQMPPQQMGGSMMPYSQNRMSMMNPPPMQPNLSYVGEQNGLLMPPDAIPLQPMSRPGSIFGLPIGQGPPQSRSSRFLAPQQHLINNRQSVAPSMMSAARNSTVNFALPPEHATPAQPYATSIAPSERSTVGQPSRYKPVSGKVAGTDVGGDGASVRSSARSGVTNLTQRFIRKPSAQPVDDEDEDEAWEKMKAAKQTKKAGKKGARQERKEQENLRDLWTGEME